MNETATEQEVELEGSGEHVPETTTAEERTRRSHEAFVNNGKADEELTDEEREALEEQRAEDPDDEDGPGKPSGEEVPHGAPVAADDQTALDETEWEDPELEKLLTDREVAKGKKREVVKKFKTLDDLAKDKLTELDLEDGTVLRVGRYRVRKTAVPSRAVSFETEPTSRLTIGVAEE